MGRIHLVVTLPKSIYATVFCQPSKRAVHIAKLEVSKALITKRDMPRDFFVNEILIPHFHANYFPAPREGADCRLHEASLSHALMCQIGSYRGSPVVGILRWPAEGKNKPWTQLELSKATAPV